jgi:hypothetical protein
MYNTDATGLIVLCPTKEFIELLEYKLERLLIASLEDSSWNYDIENLQAEIERLKSL